MTKIIKKANVERRTNLNSKISVGDILPEEGGGVLNRKVLESKDKASLIVEEAVRDAERIRTEARTILSQVAGEMEKAKKDGYEQGREAGLSSVTGMVTALEATREKFYTTAESDIIKLVLVIAEKVIGKMVREHDAAIRSIVHQAVESSLGERISVRLNPEDYKIVMSEEFEFRDVFDKTKRIAFKEDETVKKGGCVVETEVGTIDARLETQLKAIKKALEL